MGRHIFVKRLIEGELSVVELAHFASQYHHVVAERHHAEGVALRRAPSPRNGTDACLGHGRLAKLWLQFMLAVGGVAGAEPTRSTRACVRELRRLSGASIESGVGVVIAIDRVEAAIAEAFCDGHLCDTYELNTGRAIEYFEQWSARRELWLDAVGPAIDHPDARAADVAASRALVVFLDGLTARPHLRVAW